MIEIAEGFGETLRKNRKLRNFSQEQLAEAMNVTRQTISNWETGAVVPSANRLQQLSAVLGISAAELLGEAAEKDASPEPASDPTAHRRWPLALLFAGIVCALLISIAALVGIYSIKRDLNPVDTAMPMEEINRGEVDRSKIISPGTLRPLQP